MQLKLIDRLCATRWTPPDYWQTDNSSGLVMVIRNYHWLNSASRVLISTWSAPLVQTGEHPQTNGRTHTHGRYQTYYLPCYAVDKDIITTCIMLALSMGESDKAIVWHLYVHLSSLPANTPPYGIRCVLSQMMAGDKTSPWMPMQSTYVILPSVWDSDTLVIIITETETMWQILHKNATSWNACVHYQPQSMHWYIWVKYYM